MIPVTGLNHAVLFVGDLNRSLEFYRKVFGFEQIFAMPGAAFLRAPGSRNHHDLGLFAASPGAPKPPRGSVGLYHLAWEVPAIEDLAAARSALDNAGALTGESDHGASKSLYGRDPDGNEFEIMWQVPRELWGDYDRSAVIERLDWDRELARYGRPK